MYNPHVDTPDFCPLLLPCSNSRRINVNRLHESRRNGPIVQTAVSRFVNAYHMGQSRRSTSIFLISPIAFAGFNPFGQAWAQFMIVWQR